MKKDSRTKNVSRGVFWGILSKIISLILPFITRTIMIYYLGMEYVGLGSLFTSILSVLSLAELGFGSAVVFSMYKPIAEGDDAKVCALLNFYRRIYLRIGIIILSLSCLIMPFLGYLIDGDVPSDINIYYLFTFYIVSTCSGYFFGAYKNSVFTGSQRVDITNKITLVCKFITYSLEIVFLLLFRNYYFYIACSVLDVLLNNLIVVLLSRKYYPQFFPKGTLEQEEVTELKKKISGLIFNKIGIVVTTSVDTIVISTFLGLKVLGVYNGYLYVIKIIMDFLRITYTAFIPSIGNYVATREKKDIVELYHRLNFSYDFIVSWCTVCLIVMMQPFVTMWQGKDNTLEIALVICIGIYFFFRRIGDMNGSFIDAAGLWWEMRFVPLLTAGLNLTLNLIMIRYIGLFGVVLSTIIAIAVIQLPFGSGVFFISYIKDRKEWRKYMVSILLWLLATVADTYITYRICDLISVTGIVGLLLRAAVCGITGLVLLVLMSGWTKEFRKTICFVRNKLK